MGSHGIQVHRPCTVWKGFVGPSANLDSEFLERPLFRHLLGDIVISVRWCKRPDGHPAYYAAHCTFAFAFKEHAQVRMQLTRSSLLCCRR